MTLRFWIVREPGKRDEILESDVRPKTEYDGGPYERVGPGYESIEALHAGSGMDIQCRECSGLIDTGCYKKEQMIADRLCFRCNHWTEILPDRDKPSHVVIDQTAYHIAPDEKDRGQFIGFGGARFDICFFDGRRVVTHNLWRRGDVPSHFSERFPDNAKFSNGLKWEKSPDGITRVLR